MKYFLCCTGILIFIIGIYETDCSIIGGGLMMIAGSLLIIPYYREVKKIEKKRNDFNHKYPRNFMWDDRD